MYYNVLKGERRLYSPPEKYDSNLIFTPSISNTLTEYVMGALNLAHIRVRSP